MDQGITRYKLPDTDFSVLPGMYGFMIQVTAFMWFFCKVCSAISCIGEPK